jgi:hypothetical protein
MSVTDRDEPTWQPISMLPAVAVLIDGHLEGADEQHALLAAAKPKPHVLDDHTLDRVLEVYSVQLDDLWMFDEQLTRWAKGTLTPTEGAEVERLKGQPTLLRERLGAILNLAEELRAGTLDRIMEKSDLELGLEALLGLRPPPSGRS